jgi:hypothetical protein
MFAFHGIEKYGNDPSGPSRPREVISIIWLALAGNMEEFFHFP